MTNRLLLSVAVSSLSLNALADHHMPKNGLLNKAPVVLAGIVAMEEFKGSFEANGAKLGSELVGFNSKKVEEDAAVNVFNIPEANRLREANYDCHFHSNDKGRVEAAHCHDDGASEARDYAATQGSFSVEEFRQAAESAVRLFEKSLANPASIEEAKLWRSHQGREANIQVKLAWRTPDGTAVTNFLYCHEHRHGEKTEIDCHRQRNAGPNQP